MVEEKGLMPPPLLGEGAGSARPKRPRGVNLDPSRFLVALVTLLVIGALVFILVPSFRSWYHDDDLRNLHWVLEYRFEPWRALTERHALHDHIRPFTLLTLWAGTWLSDGDFWGPHLMQAALGALAVGGVAVLGRDLSGRWLGGALSALLAVTLPSFALMMSWTAWLCSTGELCCGIWAMVAARRALERPPWLIVAAALTVSAGLFKEPGSVIYPLGAFMFAVAAWRGGQRDRRVLGVAALPLLGALTFLYTWHSANILRASAGAGTGILENVITVLSVVPPMVIEGWPGWGGPRSAILGGIPLFLFVGTVVYVCWTAWFADRLRGITVRIAAAFLTVLFIAAAYLVPPVMMIGLLPMVLLALAARTRAPSAAPLVMFIVNVGLALPFPVMGLNSVSMLGGGFGLALFVGIELAGWLDRVDSRVRWPGAGRAVVVGVLAALLGARVALTAPPTRGAEHVRLLARATAELGALAQTLNARQGWVAVVNGSPRGLNPGVTKILPIYGLRVDLVPAIERSPGAVQVPKIATLEVEPAFLQNSFLPKNLLPEVSGLPPFPTPGSVPAGSVSLPVTDGYYALGVVGTDAGMEAAHVRARDTCGHMWAVEQDPEQAGAVRLTALPIEVLSICGPLTVSWSSWSAPTGGEPLLVALATPELSLFHDVPIERTIDVSGTPSIGPGGKFTPTNMPSKGKGKGNGRRNPGPNQR